MSLPRRISFRVLTWYLAGYALLAVALVVVLRWSSAPLLEGLGRGLLLGGVLSFGLLAALLSLFVRRIERLLTDVETFAGATAVGNYTASLPTDSQADAEELTWALERSQTAIRQKTTQLTQDLDRLRTVLHSMGEGVIGVDRDQRILLINQAARRMFQLKDSVVEGRPVWELIRHPQLQTWVSQALEAGQQVEAEIRLPMRTDRDLAVRVAAFAHPPHSGAVIVIVDVTELHRLERVRQEFVANASHELKTPITAIKACVETLLDGAADDLECRDRFLQTIDEQSDRLDSLVRDLLMLARIESEPTAREPRPVLVLPILNKILQQHRQAAERKQISLIGDFPATPCTILADDEALEHIIDNLVDNALKYTNSGGGVTVRIRQESEVTVLEVRDTGIGIPQQHLSRIFERFYRVDRHRSREQGGTGLGLSIVKHLVQLYGGQIQVSSKVGEGTLFQVQFAQSRQSH